MRYLHLPSELPASNSEPSLYELCYTDTVAENVTAVCWHFVHSNDINISHIERVIKKCFESSASKTIIININNEYVSSSFHVDNEYYYFYSHSRNDKGLPDSDGKAILLNIPTLNDFSNYILKLVKELLSIENYSISFAPISILDIPNNVGTSSISMSNDSISTEAISIDTTICSGKMTTVDSDMIPHTSQWQGTSEDVCGDHNDTPVSCDNVSIAGSDISNDSVAISIAGSDMSNKSSTIVRSSGITKRLNRKELLLKRKEKDRLRKAKKRLDIEYRAKERILDRNRMRACRLDEEYSGITKVLKRKELLLKKKENNRLSVAKKRRLDEEYSANEKIMNKNQKRERRLDEKYSANEREKLRVCRLDEEYRANEKIMNKNQKRERRLDEEYRANEREKLRERRLDEEYRANEREKLRERRRDEEYSA